MNHYLFDTNILLLCIRSDQRWLTLVESLNLDRSYNFISVVSVGELWSLAFRNNWGSRLLKELNQLLEQFIVLDINVENVIQSYAQIDAFSQGKLKEYPLELTARNMGKNDLWIAATASAYKLKLLTTDTDFDHLHGWLELEKLVS
jgi:predicted nucleic acid-binding protein